MCPKWVENSCKNLTCQSAPSIFSHPAKHPNLGGFQLSKYALKSFVVKGYQAFARMGGPWKRDPWAYFHIGKKSKMSLTKFKIVHTQLLPPECYKQKKKKKRRRRKKRRKEKEEMWMFIVLIAPHIFLLFRWLMLFQKWLKGYQSRSQTCL